ILRAVVVVVPVLPLPEVHAPTLTVRPYVVRRGREREVSTLSIEQACHVVGGRGVAAEEAVGAPSVGGGDQPQLAALGAPLLLQFLGAVGLRLRGRPGGAVARVRGEGCEERAEFVVGPQAGEIGARLLICE